MEDCAGGDIELTAVCSGRRSQFLFPAMIAIADVCIYRSDGYSGQAVFFPFAAGLLAFGIPGRSTFEVGSGFLTLRPLSNST